MSFKILGLSIGKNKTSEILPTNGLTGSKRARRASQSIKKQYRRELQYQIADINQAINTATNPDAPNRRRLIDIYKYVTKDLRLKGQIRDAVMKVTGEPWMIYDENENPVEDLSNKMRKRWMAQTIYYAAMAEFWAYNVLEFDQIDPAKFDIGVVFQFPHEHICIERAWVLIDGEINGSYIDYNGISNELDIVEFYNTRTDLGLLMEISYNTIWKYYSRSDWSRASEKFGAPILGIEADTNNDDELDRLERQAADFGSDGYIVTQKGDVLQIIERKGQRMHDIYYDNIKLCNEENEIGINGQVGTSSEKSFVGAAEVQERKFEDITLTRLDFVQNEINDKLFPYLRAKGFAIPEGYRFNYPTLINERNKKLNPPQPIVIANDGDGNDLENNTEEVEENNKQADVQKTKKEK